MSAAIPVALQASALGGQRGALLGAVFPTSPVAPLAPTNATRTRAQGTAQKSAAAVAAEKVAARLAANPVKPVVAPVTPTRANTPATQSAGTINTNYINSATAQGYEGVKPPDIYKPGASRNSGGLSGLLRFGGMAGQQVDARTRESFRNNVFVPNPAQVRAHLFAPPLPGASAGLQQPLSPQVGVPAATFPPRQQFLNYLFPTQ